MMEGLAALNIAHRGASGYAAEYTAAAFDLAIEMGADAIETDVRLTYDGVPVLIHDATVTRTTNGVGPVGDYTRAELQALNAGSWFDPAHAGERILTLSTFMETFIPRIAALLEIKDAAATERVVTAIRVAGMESRVHVTSFLWPAVLEAKRLAPDLTIGFLSPEFDADLIRRCVNRGLAQICPPVDTLTPELVSRAHDAGLFVRAHGISKRSQIATLFDTGADGATVNWPDWIPQHR